MQGIESRVRVPPWAGYEFRPLRVTFSQGCCKWRYIPVLGAGALGIATMFEAGPIFYRARRCRYSRRMLGWALETDLKADGASKVVV
jgi:hypothetical protein